MRIVVCDAGPVIHLYEAELLNLLHQSGDIHVSEQVRLEIAQVTDLGSNWPDWLYVDKLNDYESNEARYWTVISGLHRGEVEAFLLARRLGADWVLTDDAAARTFLSLSGYEVHGSLGVVLWNAARNNLNFHESILALDRLRDSSLWISSEIYSQAVTAIHKIFSA